MPFNIPYYYHISKLPRVSETPSKFLHPMYFCLERDHIKAISISSLIYACA